MLVVSIPLQSLPPVRNKDFKMKMRDKKKKKKKEPVGNGSAKGDRLKKTSRIKANDYQSWDKFDVVTCTWMFSYDITNKRKGPIFSSWTWCASQGKALSELDKDDSPPELNESDSEEVTFDQEKALAEKERVL